MNLPCVVVCGLTATGKTELALNLAGRFNGELLSADSRQVYRELTILSGKDIPPGFVKKVQSGLVTYTDGETRIWGYDLVNSREDFSAALYFKFARRILKKVCEEERLPIIVGGTGLYIKTLFNPPATLFIPRDTKIREKLKNATVAALQLELQQRDKTKWTTMNESDKWNPRRLIRAIEVANLENHFSTHPLLSGDNSLWLGLTMPWEILEQKIQSRVEQRSSNPGLKNELMSLDTGWPAMSATGAREMRAYFNGDIHLDDAISSWVKREVDYAKRQWVWFKKNPEVYWYDVTKSDWQARVERKVENWYAKTYG